jgi:hypothetical protein
MGNFISCNLMGGLGNQLFQAAHVLAQGMKYNREVVFVPQSWTPMQGRQTSNYVNNIFRNLKFVDNIEGFEKVFEGPWEYSDTSPKDDNTVFDGYFQSSKNFLGFDDEIKKIFSPTEEFINEMYERHPELKQKNTLSIHIRRGDCFMNPDIHPIANEIYVERAIKEIGEYSHVFVFSDDKEWVKGKLKFNNVTYVEDEDYKEMWLMSLCENHIMVNSTFSWWGTFLNTNPNKKIVAPSIWFGPRGPQNYKDIYESNWTVLDVKYNDGWLS